jgi:hypothetical protein
MDPKTLKVKDNDLDFYEQVVKVGKGWVEQEFVLLIMAALPNKAGLPNE